MYQLKWGHSQIYLHAYIHPFNGPFPALPGYASTRKVKPIWILLKQETVSGSGIRWAICKSAPRSRQKTTPAPHHWVFLQAGCPSCRPTNSVKALKAPHSNLFKKQKVSTETYTTLTRLITIYLMKTVYFQQTTQHLTCNEMNNTNMHVQAGHSYYCPPT